MNYEVLLQKLPGISTPLKRLTFNERIRWTLYVLVIYFALTQIPIWGISDAGVSQFAQVATLLGASFGSLMTLGIGPIVTSSIILQLLVGAGILGWDLSTHHGKVMFQGTQKLLAFSFALLEAIAFTLFGAIPPASGDPFTVGLVIFQVALGGWLVIFLDEIVSKWGFGSGVGLFIAAGVSKELFIKTFSITTSPTGEFVGVMPALIQAIAGGSVGFDTLSVYILPVIATLAVFGLVVYAQAMRVEIPLAFGTIRGFGRKWPLKFIYTSVMPVILTAALLINLQMWSKLLASKGLTILGTFDATTGTPLSGLMYYLNPPREFMWNILQGAIIPTDVYRVLAYTAFMVFGSMLFSIFWVSTSGMDSSNVAKQIQRSGMQIPGFRRDPRVIERVLDRYIPALAVLGGAFVGFLAAFADFSGALTSGTGLLLAVMIVYQLYEQLAQQHMEDMHPMLRKFMGGN
ncbi:MAG: preprotein translocase subunit SecY [Candidatus Aenigmarchaeota archaeon]|nr:preprotein translocase subunit SecY [Candidatus Aenigmarchaeota archaeon]